MLGGSSHLVSSFFTVVISPLQSKTPMIFQDDTLGGRNPANSPVERVNIPLFTVIFIHPNDGWE